MAEPTPTPPVLNKLKCAAPPGQTCLYTSIAGAQCAAPARYELIEIVTTAPFRCAKHACLKHHVVCIGGCGQYTAAVRGCCAKCGAATSAAAVDRRKLAAAELRAAKATAKLAAAAAALAALQIAEAAPAEEAPAEEATPAKD